MLPTTLTRFYAGQITDHADRKIFEIWKYDYEQLEEGHDYIQLLFPTRELGQFFIFNLLGQDNTKSVIPVLSDVDEAVFRQDNKEGRQLRANILKSLEMMLDFYGFAFNTEDPNAVKIARAPHFQDRVVVMLNEENGHNLLRITRILKTLKFTGLEKYMGLFF